MRLRRLEVQRLGGAERVHAELDDGPAALLNVTTRPERVRATVEVLRLGTRRARVALDGGEALLHVPAGELVARVSDEEEPFELAAGESLRLRGLPPGAELELAGETRGCEAVVVALTPAQGRR